MMKWIFRDLPTTKRFSFLLLVLLTFAPVLADTTATEELPAWVSQSQFEPEEKKSDIPILVITVIAITVLVVSFIFYNFMSSVYWNRGIFPSFLLNRTVNRYEAVTHMAVNMIRHDFDGRSEKIRYLQQFLSRQYPNIKGSVYHSYKAAFYEPLTTASTARWLVKVLKSEAEKRELFEFLFELAVLDGRMGEREQLELKVFCKDMQLSESVFTERLEKFHQAAEEQAQQEQQRKKGAEIKINTDSNYLINKYLFILGLSDAFTLAELKKAYRKWVKICHPDMLKDGSPQEKSASAKRFLEIQEAYEYLLHWKK